MKYPFMPLFLGDLLADTLHLSSQSFGAYVLLFCHAWKHEARVDVKDAQRIARVDNRHWLKVRTILAPFFEPPDGLRGSASEVVHPRVAKELANAGEISNKRKDAAMQMHAKRRANAPVLHMHPHSHKKKEAAPKTAALASAPDGALARPTFEQTTSYTPSGMSPDKGLDYRSPPREKSSNVLQPVPEQPKSAKKKKRTANGSGQLEPSSELQAVVQSKRWTE